MRDAREEEERVTAPPQGVTVVVGETLDVVEVEAEMEAEVVEEAVALEEGVTFPLLVPLPPVMVGELVGEGVALSVGEALGKPTVEVKVEKLEGVGVALPAVMVGVPVPPMVTMGVLDWE